MIRPRGILIPLVCNALFPNTGISQGQAVSVSGQPDGAAQINFADGRKRAIPKEQSQIGIKQAQIASDGTAGWLAEYLVDGVSYPIAGTLVIWRTGKIVRRFQTGQVFYSWIFYAFGKQVAYHEGPLHGEPESHCELRDVKTGRLIAQWVGDLDSEGNRPAWTRGLSH